MVCGADGLHLRIAGESKSWILRATIYGKRSDIGLGSFPGVTLSTARKLANEHRDKIAQGIDPLAERRAKAEAARAEKRIAKTFRECAEAYVAAHKGEWKNAKHIAQWKATLKTYAYPVFGSKSVATIDTNLVLEVIEALWATKTETASRLRGRIEKVLGWASFRGFRSGENPARWKDHLDHHLPMRSAVQKREHHASLPYHVLKRMERGGLTQHGFRSTFREWAGEVSRHPREVVEHALAHQLADKAEAAYQRGSLLPKRIVLMDDWAKFCATVPTGSNVVSIGGAA